MVKEGHPAIAEMMIVEGQRHASKQSVSANSLWRMQASTSLLGGN